jgi:hypothetical protein
MTTGALEAEKNAGDRCYDFKNIFAKKIGEIINVFDSKQG